MDELQKLNLPPQLSADELNKLTSQKLAAVAVMLITMDSPHGPDPDLPIDSLLAELDQTAEKPHIRSSIRRAIAERMDYVMNNPSAAATDNQVPADDASTLVTFTQSSATAIASTKHPRDAQPLKMVETEASKQRKTYAVAAASSSSSSSQGQYALSTLAVAIALVDQPDRQPHQRQVVSAKHLGAFVGHEALTMRMGSTRKTVPKPTADSRKTAPKQATDSQKIVPSAVPIHGNVQGTAAGTTSVAEATGVSLTNHFDRFVANRQQAVTGVTASSGKDGSSLPAMPAFQQSAVATLPEPLAFPANDNLRPIPNSLVLSVSDDDGDSYEDSQLPYVPDAENKTRSPLPLPIMNPSSEDDISDDSDADGEVVDTTNDGMMTSFRTTSTTCLRIPMSLYN